MSVVPPSAGSVVPGAPREQRRPGQAARRLLPGRGDDLLRCVRVVSPAPRDIWVAVAHDDPHAVPSQTPEWTDWLRRTRGFSDASRLYEFPDGRRLLLPLLARTAAGVTVTEESMPYGFGYGGPLVAGGRVTLAEARAVLADLARRPVLRAGLVPNPLVAGTWSAAAPGGALRVPSLCHVLDLEGGFDHVWSKRYRQDARRKVRRAEKQSLEVHQVRDSSLVDTFAELNRRCVDRWAQQRHQPLWLAHLVERRRDRVGQLASALAALGSAVTGWTAHLEGEAVAAYVAVQHREQAWFWMSAMDQGLAGRTNAGALLQSLAIEAACRAGARWFQLGESDPGSGVARFKAGFGATPTSYDTLRFERLPLTTATDRLRAVVGHVTAGRPAGGTVER
ncbi:GNAT family N-acetyltransferase [Geodermatophilus sp. DSM 45219]|uniref:GNAT family N-acetyltransferase n=1 Tax=Geodermatophilus sp. DSM 45219 TaxID=1881103 RepID=UPI00087FB669|nr:GNAT family N-acetyltransferase [Geodermatophilus sp. DSM 45219]SDN54771.1 Acetyltransferase involved in cellulose biosynthesis, CelD/BcsL family [Geodermatophilus sp. DSM 45219]